MKVKVWGPTLWTSSVRDGGPTESLIDAGVRLVGCVRAGVQGSAAISARRVGTGLPVWSSLVSLSVGAGD
jgi:hypothetical protein